MKIKIVTICIISILTIYGLARSSDIFFGAKVTFAVKNESTARMAITGNAKYSKEIFINGDETMVNTQGDFKYEFSPLPGVNIVTLVTKDTFGNTQKKTHTFVYNNMQEIKTAQR